MNYAVKQKLMKKCLIKIHPHHPVMQDISNQLMAPLISVSTEVTSSSTLADNARLERQPSATISNSRIGVSTSGHNPVVDTSADNVTEKRKPLGKEVLP